MQWATATPFQFLGTSGLTWRQERVCRPGPDASIALPGKVFLFRKPRAVTASATFVGVDLVSGALGRSAEPL